MNVNEYLSNWAECYKRDLTENILPFWLENGLDSYKKLHRLYRGALF